MVMDMDMDMATMDTMARGLLRLSLDMVIMVMGVVLDTVMDMAMVTTDIMARDLLMLSLLPLLSPDMDMVMDMAMDILATDMVVMDTMDIMARGLLMLSQAMDIMAMDMVMDMAMDMDMATMDTMAKQICCSFSEFSTNEVGPSGSSRKHTIFISKKINIEKKIQLFYIFIKNAVINLLSIRS